MKILLLGANGQLGQALQTRLVHHDVMAHDVHTLDITKQDAVTETFNSFAPNTVINAAAYTAVDKAESNFENAEAINHIAVSTMAKICSDINARLIHVSTDFVFDGKQSTPYLPTSKCNPINVYGKTKLSGEQALLQHLPKNGLIFRTAWLYSATGNNFVKTMLRLMNERTELNVVCDQVGSPTSANGLADTILRSIDIEHLSGIYHWTDAGIASWYDFAVAIYEEAHSIGLLNQPIQINPVPTSLFPTPAVRPAYSVLDKQSSYRELDMPALHWRTNLRNTLSELANQES